MTNQPRFLSIRWKVIFLTATVLGLASLLFIWQQHELNQHEKQVQQTEFREHSYIILDHLLQSQASQLRGQADRLIRHPGVAEQRPDKHARAEALIKAVEGMALEFGPTQNLLTVVFYDENQDVLAILGDPQYAEDLLPPASLPASRQHLFCLNSCVQQVTVPVLYQGRMTGSLSLLRSLGSLKNSLQDLTRSDIVMLTGQVRNENAPLEDMKVISDSGLLPETLLNAAKEQDWQNGLLQMDQAGQTFQMLMIHPSSTVESELHVLFVQNITARVQHADQLANMLLLSGLVAFVLALSLLYLLLRPTMIRFTRLSRLLPMLGRDLEDMGRIRKIWASRPDGKSSGGIVRDEVDELESLVLDLAERLVQLNRESGSHIAFLNIQSGQLKTERDFITCLMDTAPVLILSYGQDGVIRLGNELAKSTSGIDDLVGRSFAELFFGISQQDFPSMISLFSQAGVHRTESTLNSRAGQMHSILWFSARLPSDKTDAPTYLSVGMDITEHKKSQAEIQHMAFHDMLTQLPNRRMLLDAMRHAMVVSEEEGSYCAIIFLDLDHFKVINDGRGRNTGDLILVEIGKRLRASLRELDTVAHLGVDEFVVLLEELSDDVEFAATQSRLICEKLRQAVSLPVVLHEHSYHFTCSAGISLFIRHEVTAEAALRQANIAMTHAKTSGRNAIRFFDPEMQLRLEARSTLEADLRRAITERQFQLFYQAQMNGDGQMLGAEVLLRWLHPKHGVLSPDQFIPFAEEHVLMQPLGQWLMDAACNQLKSWEADELTAPLQLAVNVSACQFYHADFVEQVHGILARTGVNPERLKLELTESMILENIQEAVAKMLELKKTGIRFSIDDFGTAYSSLSYLTQLPLDQLKIDQSFVRNIGVRSSDDIVVQTIINMANNLGLQVIAEGVETEAQFRFLKEAGCNAFQGYLFSKPLGLGEFVDYLKRLKGTDR